VTGSAHLRHEHGCDDAFAVRQHGGTLIAAVADGCSNERFSAIGATMAVSIAVESAAQVLRQVGIPPGDARLPQAGDGEQWHRMLAGLTDQVLSRFISAGRAVTKALGTPRLNTLATTLSVIVASPPWVAACSLGDGFVVVQAADGHLDLLVRPEPSADGESTTFITTPQAHLRVQRQVAWLPDLAAVAVSTDGLEESALQFVGSDPVRPFGKFFEPLFRWVATRSQDQDETELLRFLASDRVRHVTEDDTTLVLAVCGQ
jgi:hypothetical protein